MASAPRVRLQSIARRADFALIYNELWTHYLPHIGGPGALLYCYLKGRAGGDVADPCSSGWAEDVCEPLGLTLAQSHEAWARLLEMGLLTCQDDEYSLHDPSPALMPRTDDQDATVFAAIEEIFGRPLSGAEIFQLETLREEFPEDMIVLAGRYSALANALSMPYTRQILINWKAKGITTATQAEEDHREYSLKKARRNARRGGESSRPNAAVDKGGLELDYGDEELILKRMMEAARKGGVKDV